MFKESTCAVPGGRAIQGVVLLVLDCWNRGFEPAEDMDVPLLALLCAVQAEVYATNRSLV